MRTLDNLKPGPGRRAERRRLVWMFALSFALHLLPFALWKPRPPAAPLPVLQEEKFVKRSLPLRRPLERSRLPKKVQRPLVRRPALRAAPAAAASPVPLTTRRQGLQGLPIPIVEAPRPAVEPLVLLPALPDRRIGPSLQPGAVTGSRTGEEEIDLGLEMMDAEALDTGRHRSVVIVDPGDRTALKGFLYLSGVYSESMERAEEASGRPRSGLVSRRVAERRSLHGLSDKMTEHTGVRTEVLDGLSLDDGRLLEVPFLLLTSTFTFPFTDSEARNLGRYLTTGGFVFADVADRGGRPLKGDYDLPALRSFIRAAFSRVGFREGMDWGFQRLEMSHPVYRCFFDIGTLPGGFRDKRRYDSYHTPNFDPSPDYLEGIEVGGRLAGIYSMKNYTDFWGGEAERIREEDEAANTAGKFTISAEELAAYELGINILVYALTREGTLAQKLVAVEE